MVDFRCDASDGQQLNRLQQAVLVSLHLTFLQMDDVQPGERYRELWNGYMHDKGFTEPASLQQWWTALREWRNWSCDVQSTCNLNEQDMLMTQGPHRNMTTYTRAKIGGSDFRTRAMDSNVSSNNSYFLPFVSSEDVAAGGFPVWVGQFQSFIQVVPPWEYTGQPGSTVLHFGVARWCATPTPASTPISDLPLVMRDKFLPISEDNGYRFAAWPLHCVVPTNVAVVDLDEHFILRQTRCNRRIVTWAELQAAFPTGWHWIPGYWAVDGFQNTPASD